MNTSIPSNNPKWPEPACRPYAPLLPLLRTGELSDEQTGAVRQHLAGCALCRARLADYDLLYAALRSHFDVDVAAAGVRIPSAREIAELSADSRGTPGQPGVRRGARLEDSERLGPVTRSSSTGWRSVVRRLEAVAAILLVALLGGLLMLQRSGWPGGTSTLDPQEQAYVAMLRADYLPLLDALGVDERQCFLAFGNAPASDKPKDLADCRPVEETALTDSQTLLAHLQATPTPARWRSADSQLKAWAQDQIAYFTARIQAIDAQDVEGFKTLGNQGLGVGPGASSCSAILQINADLPPDSQLPASAIGGC